MAASPDDFDRDVYCILGVPVDDVTMDDAVDRIVDAVSARQAFLCSTPNMNFISIARTDAEFRRSIVASDLSLADGVSVLLLARLLGVPLKERVSGSDLLEALKRRPSRSLSAFLLGGPEGAAERACARLNGEGGGVACAGFLNPGFGPIEKLEGDKVLGPLNRSGADLLIVALGAAKGQVWLMRNHDRLTVPFRSHLGATINFEAGTVGRAPQWVRRAGCEWLWRIKEEPYLAQRYAKDGLLLLRLLLRSVLPLTMQRIWDRLRRPSRPDLHFDHRSTPRQVELRIGGWLTKSTSKTLSEHLRRAAAQGLSVALDLEEVEAIDAACLGRLMMLKKELERQKLTLRINRVPSRIRQTFLWHGLEFVLE